MSDHDDDLRTRVYQLEDALRDRQLIDVDQTQVDILEAMVLQQTMILGGMTDQLRALFVVNTALLNTLRSQVDIEMVRAVAVDAFTDEEEDRRAVAHVHAMFGAVMPGNPPPSKDAIRDRLREIARARFTVIDGGRPDENAPG